MSKSLDQTSVIHAVDDAPDRPWRINDRKDQTGDLYEIRITVHTTGSSIGIYDGDTNRPAKIDFDSEAARLMAEGLTYAADLADLYEAKREAKRN